jgi:hypothetical protein
MMSGMEWSIIFFTRELDMLRNRPLNNYVVRGNEEKSGSGSCERASIVHYCPTECKKRGGGYLLGV